jgi:hypothetical protein
MRKLLGRRRGAQSNKTSGLRNRPVARQSPSGRGHELAASGSHQPNVCDVPSGAYSGPRVHMALLRRAEQRHGRNRRSQLAFGFCAEHTEMLRRIDIEEMKTTLSVSVLFADTFAGIVDQLRGLSPDRAFEPEPCPACASRDDYLRRNALYLLDMVATSGGHRHQFIASCGLCFPHFKMVWELARTRADRELLLSVQGAAAESLLNELREHVRKHDDKYRHEAKGPEHDSWQRAILATTGWPPPAQSAAEPEAHR